MKIHAAFIKEQFATIATNYAMKWSSLNEAHHLALENNKVLIEFQTERWDSEDGITISVTNKARNVYYYPSDLRNAKGLKGYKTYMSTAELSTLEGLKEGNDKIVYSFRILLEKQFPTLPAGDFTTAGPGKPDV